MSSIRVPMRRLRPPGLFLSCLGLWPLMIASTLGQDAAASAQSDKQRALLSNAVVPSLFGQRVLRQDKAAWSSCVCRFGLPPTGLC